MRSLASLDNSQRPQRWCHAHAGVEWMCLECLNGKFGLVKADLAAIQGSSVIGPMTITKHTALCVRDSLCLLSPAYSRLMHSRLSEKNSCVIGWAGWHHRSPLRVCIRLGRRTTTIKNTLFLTAICWLQGDHPSSSSTNLNSEHGRERKAYPPPHLLVLLSNATWRKYLPC